MATASTWPDWLPRYPSRYPPKYPNVEFYENKIPALPNLLRIGDILETWPGDFIELERNHSYIQWLFPNREPGLNPDAFTFTSEEAKQIRERKELKDKVKMSFEMMLDFYGMELTKDNKFQLTANGEERLRVLNVQKNHNFQRITRILKCLLEFGHHQLMLPWLQFLANLIYGEKKLNHAQESFDQFWLQILDADDKIELQKFIMSLKSESNNNTTLSQPTSKTTNSTVNPQKDTSGTKPYSTPENYASTGINTSTSFPNSNTTSGYKSTGNTNPLTTSKIVLFYKNELPLPRTGIFIDDILSKWKGNYDILQKNPQYTHWLFPNDIVGGIFTDVLLSPADAKIIREDSKLKEKVLKAFKMMLEFYGMELKWLNTFNMRFVERVRLLNTPINHHWKEITRILLALKNLGHKDLMLPWLKFLACLIYEHKHIPNAWPSMEQHWMDTLDDNEKKKLLDYIQVRKWNKY